MSWSGRAARRKIEDGDVKPRIRISVVSWRKMEMAGLMAIEKDILSVKWKYEI